MAKFEEYKDIFVFVEQENGNIAEVGYELISEARKLVASIPSFGYKVVGVLLGKDVKDKAQDVIVHGADKVIVVDDDLLKDYSTQFYADALTQVILKYKPDSFLTGATTLGRDLAPRVAARINVGLTADATKIEVDTEWAEKTGESLLDVTRPTFGGNLFGTIVCKDTRPQMATIRPKVFEMAPSDETRTGEVEEFKPVWTTTDPEVFVEKVIEKAKADVDITKADILVGAGRGAEGCLDLVQAVADELGGVVSCSRAVVEDGFLPKERQVGQTGKTVRPSLYIACGISGAVQHCAGMDKSDMIISINRDPQAEIFSISNMGFVGDVEKVLPLLVEAIKAAKAE
jgi:electron transfer flavoprotein alpha subunit